MSFKFKRLCGWCDSAPTHYPLTPRLRVLTSYSFFQTAQNYENLTINEEELSAGSLLLFVDQSQSDAIMAPVSPVTLPTEQQSQNGDHTLGLTLQYCCGVLCCLFFLAFNILQVTRGSIKSSGFWLYQSS